MLTIISQQTTTLSSIVHGKLPIAGGGFTYFSMHSSLVAETMPTHSISLTTLRRIRLCVYRDGKFFVVLILDHHAILGNSRFAGFRFDFYYRISSYLFVRCDFYTNEAHTKRLEALETFPNQNILGSIYSRCIKVVENRARIYVFGLLHWD